jgi:hypothetical protein
VKSQDVVAWKLKEWVKKLGVIGYKERELAIHRLTNPRLGFPESPMCVCMCVINTASHCKSKEFIGDLHPSSVSPIQTLN